MSVQNHMAIKQIVAEIFQPGPYVVFWPTDTAIPRAMLLAIYLTYNATKIFLNIKIVHLSSWSGIFLQKIPSLYAWLKDQSIIQQSGGSLSNFVSKMSFLVCLNLAQVPSGDWSRWRWRGPWPVLMGQTGEHHDQSPGPIVIEVIMISPPQNTRL